MIYGFWFLLFVYGYFFGWVFGSYKDTYERRRAEVLWFLVIMAILVCPIALALLAQAIWC